MITISSCTSLNEKFCFLVKESPVKQQYLIFPENIKSHWFEVSQYAYIISCPRVPSWGFFTGVVMVLLVGVDKRFNAGWPLVEPSSSSCTGFHIAFVNKMYTLLGSWFPLHGCNGSLFHILYDHPRSWVFIEDLGQSSWNKMIRLQQKNTQFFLSLILSFEGLSSGIELQGYSQLLRDDFLYFHVLFPPYFLYFKNLFYIEQFFLTLFILNHLSLCVLLVFYDMRRCP